MLLPDDKCISQSEIESFKAHQQLKPMNIPKSRECHDNPAIIAAVLAMKRLPMFLLLLVVTAAAGAQRKSFTVVEASIADMQKALREKRVTSRELVQQYLTRIALYNP